MYHYNEPVQDTKGNALTGYYIGLVVPDDSDINGGTEAVIYADDAATPIVADSGLEDRAKVDPDGMVSLWVPPDEYHVDIYAQDGVTKLKRLLNIPMLSGQAGAAASITIGTTTTLSAGSAATVTNSGSAQNAVLNFGVPMGATGSGTTFAWGAATGTLSSQTDLQNALNLKANLASPTFTGAPLAPTPTLGDNSTKVATTAYVLANAAGLASPAFTGTPTAPTATVDTSTTQLATTAFVLAQASPSPRTWTGPERSAHPFGSLEPTIPTPPTRRGRPWHPPALPGRPLPHRSQRDQHHPARDDGLCPERLDRDRGRPVDGGQAHVRRFGDFVLV
jgi:hypothetical protein